MSFAVTMGEYQVSEKLDEERELVELGLRGSAFEICRLIVNDAGLNGGCVLFSQRGQHVGDESDAEL